MSLFHRFFVPEIESLKGELARVQIERDWFRERCGELGTLANKRQSKLDAEIKRNREREDLLNNQIIELGGGRPLPQRIEIPRATETLNISDAEAMLLRERAREILEQQTPGAEITNDQLERAVAKMKEDPEYWLGN